MFAVLAAAAGLLVCTGVAKLRRPGPASAALRAARLPGAGRALGAVEVVVGVACLAVGRRAELAAMALVYLGFAGFVVLARRPGSAVSSCGCAGTPDTPPTWTHAAIDLALAAAATGALLRPPAPLADQLTTPAGIVAALLAGVLGGLLWLAVTALPRLVGARTLLRA